MATDMEFNEAEAPAAGRRPTDDTGSPLELDSEAYIE